MSDALAATALRRMSLRRLIVSSESRVTRSE
jgi:hypothetical protein